MLLLQKICDKKNFALKLKLKKEIKVRQTFENLNNNLYSIYFGNTI